MVKFQVASLARQFWFLELFAGMKCVYGHDAERYGVSSGPGTQR